MEFTDKELAFLEQLLSCQMQEDGATARIRVGLLDKFENSIQKRKKKQEKKPEKKGKEK